MTSRCAQKFEKLDRITSALRPTRKPMRIRAIKDKVFAEVKTFWMSLPTRSPRVLMKVRKTTRKIATSCCVERLIAYRDERLIGAIIHETEEIAGRSAPRYLVNATATAAIVPDRKSTRLNSSHVSISYAVFCLKKKKH